MAFSIYEVIRVAQLSVAWLVRLRPVRNLSLANDLVNAKSHATAYALRIVTRSKGIDIQGEEGKSLDLFNPLPRK